MRMRFSDLRFSLALILPMLAIYSVLTAPQHAFGFTLLMWLTIAGLDMLLPARSPEPIRAEQSQLWFRTLLRLYVPLQMLLIAAGVWAAMRADWAVVLGLGISVGYVTGAQGITFAHELGHSKSKADRFMAWLLMTSVCYGHFMVEHYRGHHPRAATLQDPASARYGESLYRFLPRTLMGCLTSGWRLEAQRLMQMKSSWSKSPLVWSTMGSVSMVGLPFFMLFMQIVPVDTAGIAMKIVAFFLFQSIVAILMLEIVNYIEHYGLQRSATGGTDGKREAFGMMHAWNADHIMTNSLLANLQRHSDHHMHAWKPYGTLQAMPQGPQLPTGYAGCLLIAAIPPLWFALMHPRLQALRSVPTTA
jgi:alkane 1-monooxygenase